MTSVVWWLKDGRHQLTNHYQNTGTWQTACGLTIPDTGDEEAVTTITPQICCGRCMTTPARNIIDAARQKHQANTAKYDPKRFT